MDSTVQTVQKYIEFLGKDMSAIVRNKCDDLGIVPLYPRGVSNRGHAKHAKTLPGNSLLANGASRPGN